MRSSYAKNNYGEVFKATVQAFKPKVCVELGVLDGYSTLAISDGIRSNGFGGLDAYDLFESYEYKHSNYEDVKKTFADRKEVNLIREDAYSAHSKYDHVDFIHVDISNTGEIVKEMMERWDKKIVRGGIIMFEGGSEERDKLEWMVKYDKSSIKKELETNKIIEEKYVFATYLRFPSLTVLLKKRD